MSIKEIKYQYELYRLNERAETLANRLASILSEIDALFVDMKANPLYDSTITVEHKANNDEIDTLSKSVKIKMLEFSNRNKEVE